MERLTEQSIIEYGKSVGESILQIGRAKGRWIVSLLCSKGHSYSTDFQNFKCKGTRCSKCARDFTGLKTQYTFDKFLSEIEKKPTIKFVELLDLYVGVQTNVTLCCDAHGNFATTVAAAVRSKHCCQQCSREAIGSSHLLDFEEVKNKVILLGYKLITDKYIDSKKLLDVECTKHGIFKIRWNDLSMGHGCRKCASELLGLSCRLDEDFVKQVAEAAGYVYKSREFVMNSRNKSIQYLLLRCKKHGDFKKQWDNLREGGGCGKCGQKSFKEEEIDKFINDLGFSTVARSRKLIGNKELDIFVPSKRFAIEYNGNYWHSELRKGKYDHSEKYALCLANNISMLAIFEDEWKDDNKKALLKEMIKNRLGICQVSKLRASKLELRKINNPSIAKGFFDKFHLDGFTQSSFGFGLYLDDTLITCAIFRRTGNSECWELARFANDYNFYVHGGFSRIMKNLDFEGDLISYSNNRLSFGNVYEVNGFEEITQSKSPGYWYTDFKNRIFRTQFMRNNAPDIIKDYPTEASQAKAGLLSKPFGHKKPIYKIYDYGHRKWILRRPSV